ncbi:MAG: DUF5131 family protein [Pirellulales bacterium]|nr:DUF5131 family protein [Pirellulales bacterium]
MGKETLVAWTDHTFNAWMGCTKISEGCRHCYAETFTKNRMGKKIWGPGTDRPKTKEPWRNVVKWNREAATTPGILGEGQPHLVFTGSLMDWAEDHAQAESLRPELFALIRECPHLHFQMLTKRADRIADCLPPDWGDGYPNVWLGTSIEDMRVGHRADSLREIPAVVRFISYEPALGPLDGLDLTGIDWVIYGGESGPGHRPEGTPDDPKAWARSMGLACDAAGVAYFHKQSAAARTEMGIELDGKIVRKFPTPRPRRGDLPQFKGQYVDITGGVESAAYVRGLRDDDDDEPKAQQWLA